jgi:hypothetical protein
MRRWAVAAVAILTTSVVVTLWVMSAPGRLTHLTASTVGAVLRATEHGVVTAVRERVAARLRCARALERAVTPALADESMQFKPLAPESAAHLESRAARTRAASHARTAPDTLTRLPEPAAAAPPPEPIPPPTTRHSGEMMRIGSDIHIEKDQTVDGDVVAISGDVRVDGHVRGSVQALGGDVYLGSSSRVDGDVAAVRGELHEEPGASVGGQRVTALSGRASRFAHQRLLGMEGSELLGKPLREAWRFVRTLIWMLVMLGLVWLALRIVPQRTQIAVDVLRHETAASLGIGLLTWVLLVPSVIALCLVVAILCITIIGIPVALAALMAYALLLVVLLMWGAVVGNAWLGAQLHLAGASNTLRCALLGTVAVLGLRAAGHLIAMIPFFGFLGGFLVVIGWILGATVTTLGAGALLRSEFASGQLGRWWRGWRGGPGPPAPAPVMPAAPIGAPPAETITTFAPSASSAMGSPTPAPDAVPSPATPAPPSDPASPYAPPTP